MLGWVLIVSVAQRRTKNAWIILVERLDIFNGHERIVQQVR